MKQYKVSLQKFGESGNRTSYGILREGSVLDVAIEAALEWISTGSEFDGWLEIWIEPELVGHFMVSVLDPGFCQLIDVSDLLAEA